MSNFEDFSQTETNATQLVDVFEPNSQSLSSIKCMDSSRNNSSTDELLASLTLTDNSSNNEPQLLAQNPEQQPEQSPKQPEQSAEIPTEKKTEQVDRSWEEAEKLREKAIQDCRDGKFGDALKHRSEALSKYSENYAKDPADTPAEQARQKANTTQLNHVFTCALNKIKVAPDWTPPTGDTFPNSQDARPKPKMDQTPINEMIQK